MTQVDMTILITLDTETYREAEHEAKAIANAIGIDYAISASAVLDYEYDNEHQRVIYLHPVVVGVGQSEEFPQVAAGVLIYLDEVRPA